jgi:hypothetical protein
MGHVSNGTAGGKIVNVGKCNLKIIKKLPQMDMNSFYLRKNVGAF